MPAHSSREEAASFSDQAYGAILYALSEIPVGLRLSDHPRVMGVHEAFHPFLLASDLPFVKKEFTFRREGYSPTLSSIQGTISLGGGLVNTYDGFSFSVRSPVRCALLARSRLSDRGLVDYFKEMGREAAARFGRQ